MNVAIDEMLIDIDASGVDAGRASRIAHLVGEYLGTLTADGNGAAVESMAVDVELPAGADASDEAIARQCTQRVASALSLGG